MKPIRLSAHCREQLHPRGTTEAEIVQAIRHAFWEAAEHRRSECRQNIPFNAVWNGKQYGTKQVRPIFVEEADEIVVVTVYVYYF